MNTQKLCVCARVIECARNITKTNRQRKGKGRRQGWRAVLPKQKQKENKKMANKQICMKNMTYKLIFLEKKLSTMDC